MTSILARAFSPLFGSSISPKLAKPLLNSNLKANAWVGSYRIENPEEFRDTFPKPRRWPRYNERVQPPQVDANEERRPATFYHSRANVKHSPKKLWYVMKFIRGMSIDEAIKQLKFMPYKGAQITAGILEEAQMLAVRDHNFEFKSNMWVEEAKCGRGLVIKGFRKHARMRFGVVRYYYSHIMVKLTEGDPPVHYYRPKKDGNDLLKDFYDDLRSRKILQGL